MKCSFIIAGMMICLIGVYSCENSDDEYGISIAHKNNSEQSRGGQDTIPPTDSTGNDGSDTGGETGQIIIKP